MHEQRELPSPNAHDFYAEAGRRTEEALKRDDRFMRTFEAPDPESVPEEARAILPSGPIAYLDLDSRSPEEQSEILARSADGLRVLREGLRHACMVPWEVAASTELSTTYLTAARCTAKVLSIEADVYASGGDFANATDSLLDIIQLGTDIARGGMVVQALTGGTVAAIGVMPAWEFIDSLNADEARAAARRMEDIAARSWPLVETIEGERRYYQAQLTKTLGNPFWKLAEATNVDPLEAESGGNGSRRIGWESIFSSFIRLLPLSRKRVLADFDRCMDEQIARTKMPYAEVSRMPEVKPGMPFEYVFDYSRGPFRLQPENARTQKALLTVSLALRAFLLERGRHPQALSELVPEYLREVPADPFADGAPLRYRVDGDGYVLYSVGPDGVDDGGTAIAGPWPADDCSCCLQIPPNGVMPDSKGDIVAGVNW